METNDIFVQISDISYFSMEIDSKNSCISSFSSLSKNLVFSWILNQIQNTSTIWENMNTFWHFTTNNTDEKLRKFQILTKILKILTQFWKQHLVRMSNRSSDLLVFSHIVEVFWIWFTINEKTQYFECDEKQEFFGSVSIEKHDISEIWTKMTRFPSLYA